MSFGTLGVIGGGIGGRLSTFIDADGCIVISSAPLGTTEIWHQPWADAANDDTNRTYLAYTGPGQKICGFAPGSVRIGSIGPFDTEMVVPTINLLFNTVFADGVTGTPGTAPTAWALSPATVITATYAGAAVTISGDSVRGTLGQTKSVLANSTYFYSIEADITTSDWISQFLGCVSPSGSVLSYYIDGVLGGSTTFTGTGVKTLAIKIDVGETAGNSTPAFGVGLLSAKTNSVVYTKPQFQIGGERTAYQAITATS